MADLFFEVKQLALSLPEGCSDSSCACPKCGKAGSFSITRDSGQLKFICFRVSCKFHGVVDSATGKGLSAGKSTIKTPKLFTGALDALSTSEVEYLSNKFIIKPEWLSLVRWGVDDNRVYFPQYNTIGKVHGYIARHYPDLGRSYGNKAYWKPVLPTEAGLCFPSMQVLRMVREQQRVLLVEDYPSCLRVLSQTGVPCCCLGGTNLYASMINTMMQLNVKQVAVALDADAITKAVSMRRLLSLSFASTLVIPLTGADLKDMDVATLAATLKPMR
jgi:hypothetical protein